MQNGYVYIYGYKESYNPVNKSRNDILRKDNPSVWSQSYYERAQSLIGKRAIDCSGLVCQALGISDIGSYAIADLPKTRPDDFVSIPLASRIAGDIVWKEGHVGMVYDLTTVVEARSASAGVNRFSYTSQPWVRCIHPIYKVKDYDKGWHVDENGTWYAYGETRGSYYKNCVKEIDGSIYVFDEEGYLLKSALVVTNEGGEIVRYLGERY